MVRDAEGAEHQRRNQRRGRLRQLGLGIFLAAIFAAPILAMTVFRDEGPLLQSLILPGLIIVGLVIFFASANDALRKHPHDGAG